MSRPVWQRPIRTEEQKIPQFPDTIVIGGFRINTTSTGSLETKPVGAPPSQDPADLVQPASLRLGDSAITLEASAEFGGSIVLKELLDKLLDIPIFSIEGVEMPIRSLFGSLFSRVAAGEAVTADLSGVRIPAVLNEVVNNASLDAAREAAQLLKDSVQDASGVLIALAAGTASADIASLSERLGLVEAGAGAVDLSGVFARLDGAESQIAILIDQKVDLPTYEAEKANFASAGDLSNLTIRVDANELSISGNSARLDAVEVAIPTKVAQADYDVAVAHLTASVATAQAAAESASTAASTAQTLAEGAEVKGLMSKMIVETHNTAGISETYWAETIGGVLMATMEAGKVAEYIFDGPATVALVPSEVYYVNKVLRLRNGNESGLLTVTLGGQSYEIVEKETVTLHYDGGSWKLM